MKRLFISDVILPEIRGDEKYFARRVESRELNGLMDPFLSIEHFVATDNVIGPQQHAGVSTLQYIFEDSAPYHSMDSEGNNQEIAPGGLLWNWTGSGLIHLENTAIEGASTEGIQLVLKPSNRTRAQKPKSLYLSEAQIPETNRDGVRVRMVNGPGTSISELDEMTLVHISMAPGKVYQYLLAPNWSVTLFAIEGHFDVMTNYETHVLEQGMVLAMSHSDYGEPIEIYSITPCRLIMVSGRPHGEENTCLGASIGKSYPVLKRQKAPRMGQLQQKERRQPLQ